MKQLILHIGRHKTGTTAIQRFLARNRDLLEAHNFCYPSYGIRGFGHHEIGAPLTRAHLSSSTRQPVEIIEELRHNLYADIGDNQSVVVISSESFQNCDPDTIRQLFPDYDVTVVVYLREQISYLLSAYTQKVQASDYSKSLEDFCTENSSRNYQDFLDPWKQTFNARIIVRNYDSNELLMGNVVVDFCQNILQLNGATVSELCSEVDANPSLTRDLLEFKLRVNQHLNLSKDQLQQLYNGLATLSMSDQSGKLVATKELANKVHKHFRKSNANVAREYFNRRELFSRYKQPANPPLQETLEQRLVKIKNELIALRPELSDSLTQI